MCNPVGPFIGNCSSGHIFYNFFLLNGGVELSLPGGGPCRLFWVEWYSPQEKGESVGKMIIKYRRRSKKARRMTAHSSILIVSCAPSFGGLGSGKSVVSCQVTADRSRGPVLRPHWGSAGLNCGRWIQDGCPESLSAVRVLSSTWNGPLYGSRKGVVCLGRSFNRIQSPGCRTVDSGKSWGWGRYLLEWVCKDCRLVLRLEGKTSEEEALWQKRELGILTWVQRDRGIKGPQNNLELEKGLGEEF